MEILGTFHLHPEWYMLLAIGLQVIFINCMLIWFEFSPKIRWELRLKRSLLARRFGILALTVFSFASSQFLIRFVLSLIFPSIDFRERISDIPNNIFPGTSVWWAILPAALQFLLWWGFLRLWKLGKYKGSLEWCMIKLSGKIKENVAIL